MKLAVLFSLLSVILMSVVESVIPVIRAIGNNVHFLMFWACVLVVTLDTFLGVRAARKRYDDGELDEAPKSGTARRMLVEKGSGYAIAIIFGFAVQIAMTHAGVDTKIFGITIDPVWASWAFILYVEGWSYIENLKALDWKFPPIVKQVIEAIFKRKKK